MIGHFVAGFLKFRGDQRGSFLFLRGEFRIFVEMFVGGQQRVGFFVDALVQIVLRKERRGDAERSGERKDGCSNGETHRVTSDERRHSSTARGREYAFLSLRLRGRAQTDEFSARFPLRPTRQMRSVRAADQTNCRRTSSKLDSDVYSGG